jgi:hypothetical protein
MDQSTTTRPLTRRRFLAGAAGAGAAVLTSMSLGASSSPVAAAGPDPQINPAGFWAHISTSTPNVFDDQLLAHFVQNFAGITLRSWLHAPDPRCDFASVVQRIKAMNPQIPVLLYTHAEAYHPGGQDPKESILEGYQELGDLLMTEWPQGPTFYFGDPRKPEFRQWLIDRTTTWVEALGCDGAFFDAVQVTNSYPLPDDEIAAYLDGIRTLFDEMTTSLGPDRLTMYNGLWSDEGGALPGMLDRQLTLLPHTNAAFIEYFGFDPVRNNQADVVPYLTIPTQFPDKTLIFNGRGLYAYGTYQDDYLRQRYDYTSYLLAAGDHAYFKYCATFSEVTPTGRTGADAFYADWGVALGDALGAVSQLENGLYVRKFELGVVVVNPEPPAGQIGQTQVFRPGAPVFDPEGKLYRNSVPVDPGVGLLLLYRPILPKSGVQIDFGDPAAPGGDWPSATRHDDYLHLDATAPSAQWQHDVLLDVVRSLNPATTVHIQARTQDPACRLDLVVEVDDADGVADRAIVAIGMQPMPAGTPSVVVPTNPFRSPNRATKRDSFAADVALVADGHWHNVSVNAQAIFAAAGGRYTARRLSHLRLIGTLDVRAISVPAGAR